MILPDKSKSPIAELPSAWLEEAVRMERYGASAQARVLKECANDLERAMKAVADRLLSLSEAADASGYSADHLGRLVRQGRIPNVGRRNKPLVREGDLPRRAAKLDAQSKRNYDPKTDARNLRSRGRRVA